MLSKIEELKLVTRCTLFDDRDAFGRLVEEYQSEMRRFFLNMSGGNAALSDDLAQETFLKAYLSIRGFKGLSKFKTWLYRIAYNEYYDWARKRKEELGDGTESPERNGTEHHHTLLHGRQADKGHCGDYITAGRHSEIPLVKSKKQTCRLPRQELKNRTDYEHKYR